MHATAVARYHTRMYTQCPDCLTVFELDMATLTSAHGRVCCGYCSAEFDTLRSLSSELPNSHSGRLPAHPDNPSLPRLLESIWQPPLQLDASAADTESTRSKESVRLPEATSPLPVSATATTDHPASTTGDTRSETETPVTEEDTDVALVQMAATAIPGFVQVRQHSGLWWLGSLFLVLLLVGQIAYSERGLLIRNNWTRNWVEQVYQITGSPLPRVRDPTMLQLLDRDIRPHPSVPGALLISANLRNRAPFPQPYPVVEVILSNLKGQRIAMRRFRPQAYVSNRTQRRLGLPAGGTAAISFEVVDPGQKAVAFEIHLQ